MCDRFEPARVTAGSLFSTATTATHEELYALGLDAVIIATPDFAHREPAVDAARAGIHLMIEKPLATSVEDARAIHGAIIEAGVTCLVAFENRWNPHFLRLRELISEGALGDIVSVSGILSNTYAVPEGMLSWAGSSSPGWFLMPHTLDLAAWLSDSLPSSVVGRGQRGVLASRGIDTWDQIHALVEMDNGAIASLRSAWILPESGPAMVDFRVEVLGTKGSATVDLTNQGLTTATETYATRWALPAVIDGHEQSMAAWMVRSWARNLIAGTPVGPDSAHGLLITETLDELHRSI
jgi:predicted dehydrogenase